MEAHIIEPEPAGARVPPRRARDADTEARGPAAYAAELLGTLVLVMFVVLVVSLTAAPPDGLGFADFAVIGLVHLLVLALLVVSLGSASGAHFNPAVTIALLVKRKIAPADAGIYIVLQLVGAVLGALIAKSVNPDAVDAVKAAAPAISEELIGGQLGRGMIAEFIGTFVLMWAIMATAVDPRGNRQWAAFYIGGALALGVMVLAPITGASFNPARAFGPALVGEFPDAGDFLLAYVLAPVLGALAAALAYTAIVLAPQDRLEQRPVDTLDHG